MSKTLLIDDLRSFRDDPTLDVNNIYVARSSQQAIELLDTMSFDDVWWDHDLGGDDTTQFVADYLLKNAIVAGDVHPIKTCYIHTSNSVGALNLKNTLESRYLNYSCVRVDQTTTNEIFTVQESYE